MIDVTLVMFADAANLSADGKLNLLGEFNILLTQEPPWALLGRTLVVRLEGHAGDAGAHTIAFRVLDQDRALMWASGDTAVTLPPAILPGTPMRHLVIVALPPIILPNEGAHELEILVDRVAAGSGVFYCIRQKDMPKRAGA